MLYSTRRPPVARLLLSKPVPVKREEDGSWSYTVFGTFGRSFRGWPNVPIPVAEVDEANAAGELAASTSDETSECVNVWCPRGDSNTRHAV